MSNQDIQLPTDADFYWGEELLSREFGIEDEVESVTEQLLANDQLGKRAPEMYREIGNALSHLTQLASCQWGCNGGDHVRENLIRRLVNYSFATLRVLRLGFYNEAVGLLRGAGELANMIELFTLNEASFAEWLSLPEKDRWPKFRPAMIQKRIAATGNPAIVDRATYSAMCEFGVHVTPSSATLSHQFDNRVHVGAEFAAPAFLLVVNELAIMLGAFLKLAGHFARTSAERKEVLAVAGTRLESTATSFVRVTNYRETLNMGSAGSLSSNPAMQPTGSAGG